MTDDFKKPKAQNRNQIEVFGLLGLYVTIHKIWSHFIWILYSLISFINCFILLAEVRNNLSKD